jgi:hypothetical protein
VSFRIPAPVNTALDWVSRNRWPITGASVALAVVTAAYTQSAAVAAGACAAMAAGAVLTVLCINGRHLRKALAQARYDMGAMQDELDERRTGDPTAPTVQLRTIGDGGEPT